MSNAGSRAHWSKRIHRIKIKKNRKLSEALNIHEVKLFNWTLIPVNISNHFLLFSLCKEQGPVWRIYLLLWIRSIQVKYPQTEETDITLTFFVTQTFPNQSQDYLVWIPFSLISIIIVILVDVGNWYLDVTQQWLVSCCQSSHQ